MIFRRATALVLAVGTLGLTAGVSPVEAANVTIKGTLGAVNQGYKVLLVTSAGATVTATADATGAFKFVTSKAASNKASLQLVDTKNRYAGPVVIAKQKAGTAYCANTRLAGKSVNLGSLALSGGAAVTKKSPSATTYLAAGVPAKSKAGIPTAAGTAGIVRMTAFAKKKAACSKAKTGVKGASAFNETPVLGADLDADGLPNALDADDDGDQVIDAVDPTTTQTAALNPWVSLRSSNPLYNANISPTLSASDVVAVLGTSGNYNLQFFIGQNNFVSGDKASTLNAVKHAWVDCGALVYCGGSAPTARNLNTHLANNNVGVEWKTYNGGFAVENAGSPATSGLDTTLGANPAGTGNALYLMNRNRDGDPNSVYWLASMFPNQGAETLNTMKPGDVFTVRYVLATGEEKSIVMMLNPHAVTVPGLATVNGAAYTGGALVGDAAGKLKLEFFRPQRLATTGETGTFKDMGGLRYGMIYMPPPGPGSMDTPCAAGAYSDNSGFNIATGTDMAERLWPMTDKQTTDSDSGTGAAKLTFTLDAKACIGAAWDAAASGTSFNFQLTAAGETLTGGANRAALDLVIKKP